MSKKRFYRTYKRGEVVYVDFGWKPHGVEGSIRPAVVVSSNASNHKRAPQVTVCPLSTKLKDIRVHVKIHPLDVSGYHLRSVSDFMPEDIQTVSKSAIRGRVGYITVDSDIMNEIDRALVTQLGLQHIVTKMVKERCENAEKGQDEEVC